MLNLFIRCFSKKYFQFKGRASRKEYLFFLIFNSLLLFLMGVLINISSSNIFIITLAGVYKLISIFPSISVTVRRVHDLNLSAWWCTILIVLFSMLIPFIKISTNIIALCALIILGISIFILSLFVIFKKGTDGVNDYGQPPEY
jgi:uncharacterized membrane protein YhaH (DUF805 family)